MIYKVRVQYQNGEDMKGKKKTITVYIPKEQDKWLTDMAELNDRPKSYFVQLALDKLIEILGGY